MGFRPLHLSASNPSGSRAMQFRTASTGNGTGLSMSIITTYRAGEPMVPHTPPSPCAVGTGTSPRREGVRGDAYPPSSISSSLFRACAICSMRQGLLSYVRATHRLSSSSRVNLSHFTMTWPGASDAHFINSVSVPSSELFS